PVLLPDARGVNAVAYDRTGTRLLLVGSDAVVVEIGADSQHARRVGAGGVRGAVFRDGSLLAVARTLAAGDSEVGISSYPEDRVEARLTSHREVTCVAVIDETRVLVGTARGEIEIHDVGTQKTVLVLRGGGEAVRQI